jgi:hypothetical protein
MYTSEPSKRYSAGRRTAWLRPFRKSFAVTDIAFPGGIYHGLYHIHVKADCDYLLRSHSPLSPWPEPPKRPRSQQAVHEPIHYFLDRHPPGLTFPDAIAQLT